MGNQPEQARLVKTLLSNCTFDRASLFPTYRKPFDLFAKGAETGDWLLRLDSNQQPSGEQAETTLLAALCRALRRRSDACANPQEISRFSSFALCRPWSRFAAFLATKGQERATHCIASSVAVRLVDVLINYSDARHSKCEPGSELSDHVTRAIR